MRTVVRNFAHRNSDWKPYSGIPWFSNPTYDLLWLTKWINFANSSFCSGMRENTKFRLNQEVLSKSRLPRPSWYGYISIHVNTTILAKHSFMNSSLFLRPRQTAPWTRLCSGVNSSCYTGEKKHLLWQIFSIISSENYLFIFHNPFFQSGCNLLFVMLS